MSKYLIRLNGAPWIIVTCPDYMDPIKAARDYLTHGIREGVTVEPANGEPDAVSS